MFCKALLSFLFVFSVVSVDAEICTKSVCEFQLDIRRIRTMTYAQKGGSYNVELDTNNKLKIVPNSLRLDGNDPLLNTYVDPDKVVTAGGFIRNVITVNGQFPGPNIEVMEGAEVVVKVTNHLRTDGISIHWHGLYMLKTPWMDGVSYITQCPILPRQSFTYRFKAYPSGTHWYHAHNENMRLDGLYGMLLVHKLIPAIPQHTAMIADWWLHDAETLEILNPWAIHFKGTGEMHLTPNVRDYSADGVQLGAMDHDLYATIINGRGKGKNGEAYPLEIFSVIPGGRSRFRVVQAGAEYAFYVSVDSHSIYVVATDGYEIAPLKVSHIILQPGETVDFEMEANQPSGNYWMRVRTIRAGTDFDVKPDAIIREGLAIVRYSGAMDQDPTSNDLTCTQAVPCVIFNCPFAGFADSHFKRCVTFNDAKSAIPKSELDMQYGVSDPNFEEYFVAFSFSVGSGVNGKKFIHPTVPLYQPHEDAVVHCDKMDCSAGCFCTQFLNLPFNKTVQMIFTNVEPGQMVFSHHPIHVHGHGFAVLKVGYPEYNTSTGLWSEPQNDIICNDKYCNPARWNGGPPSDLNQVNPPVKDTITIPARGYVVLRFRTDNPGFWLVHCHAEQHIMDGMAIVFNEAPELHPRVPTNFPKCADFDISPEEYQMYEDVKYGQKPHDDQKPDDQKPDDQTTTPAASKPSDNDNMVQDGMHRISANDVVIEMDKAIGTAFGLVFVGAIIAIVPLFFFILCKKNDMSKSAGKAHVNDGFVG